MAGQGANAFIISNYAPNSGDTYTITGVSSATYASSHASTTVNNTVTFTGLTFGNLTAGTGLSSPSDPSDYSLPAVNGYTQAGQITPRQLTVISSAPGATTLTKIYDGTTDATAGQGLGALTINNYAPNSGDHYTISGLNSATYASVHASNALDNLVTFSGLTLGNFTAGTGLSSASVAGDYTLTSPSGTYSQLGQITPRPVNIQSQGTLSKEYDGTLNTMGTTAQVSAANYQVTNLITGDSASVTAGSALYNALQVLQARYIEANNLELSQLTSTISQLSDYIVATPSVRINAQITPKALTAVGLSVAPTKTYDGKLSINVIAANNSTLLGVIGTDQVTLNSQLKGLFADRNVGTNKAISLPASNLIGQDASNYTVQADQPLTSSITKALLVLQPQAETVDYGALPVKEVLSIGLQSDERGIQDSVNNLYALFAPSNKIRVGKNCCTIMVQTGYTVQDGNGGNNYDIQEKTAQGSVNARLPGSSTGTATTAANPNGGGGKSGSSVDSNNLWANGRNASGENNGLSLGTTDKTPWNVTDPVTSKRALLGCHIFALAANETVCGRELTHHSGLVKTSSSQTKIK